MRPKENEFSPATRELLARQTGYVCSNPECSAPTAGADVTLAKAVSVGRAAHIHSASPAGPRFDSGLSPEEVRSPENGVWLCAICADLIDKNQGVGHPAELLREWKAQRLLHSSSSVGRTPMSEIGGTFSAVGVGEVTGLHVTKRNVRIQPGTVANAAGIGKITGGKFE